MKNSILLVFILLLMVAVLQAQDKYMTKVGHIQFYSHAKLEDIKAHNNEVSSVLNIKTGEIVFVVLIKSFKFKNALMEEHFNENYMESDKFPKAKFKGTIAEISKIDLTKPGKYETTIEGDLEIHGITKRITQRGTFEVNDGKIEAQSIFTIFLKDFGIAIESGLSEKIAETIEITVEMNYELLK